METQKNLYDERYRGDYRKKLEGFEVARVVALEHFILKVIRLNGGKKILDYGSGRGLHVQLWEKLFNEAELHFCDISEVAIEKLKMQYPQYADRCRTIIGNDSGFDNNMFDVVVSIEVMEHVMSLHEYIKEIHRILKPGGRFIWTTPCANILSIEHIYSKITNQIERTNEGSARWQWDEPTHLRRLKTGEIKEYIETKGFQNCRFRLRSHFFSFFVTYFPGATLKKARATLRPWRLWSRIIPAGFSPRLGEQLMKWDYFLFRRLPNGASMLGCAIKRSNET
jgi:ubiquinone/menaquinone biosynthesis C-methylase UbiE